MKDRMYFFDYVNYVILSILIVVTLYPFINIFAVSLSSYAAYLENPLRIWPADFTWAAYNEILAKPELPTSYINTIIITILTVVLGIFLYLLTAYPLSRKDLRGKGIFMSLIVFTMMFNGGLIPNFYLIRSLGLYNSLWSLILTALFSAYNVTLMKNFMETIPDSLVEAARIDGASEFYILFKIIAPLSKAIIATLCMFVAVSQWNSYFNAIIYIKDVSKWPLTLFLREIILGSRIQEIISGTQQDVVEEVVEPVTMQYAALIVTIVPILCVYPFVQKYFVQGMMVGSVKE